MEYNLPLISQVEKRTSTGDTCLVAMIADSRLYEYFGNSVIATSNNLVDVLAGSEIIYRRQNVGGFQVIMLKLTINLKAIQCHCVYRFLDRSL